MPNTLEILELPDTGQLQLSLLDSGGNRLTAPPVTFPFPVTDAEQQEIVWLLTEYSSHPFGDSRSRANAVESGLRDLGRLILETVFRSSPEASDILSQLTRNDAGAFSISIISLRPAFLALPWELLNSPEAGYLANRAEALTRQSATAADLPSFSTTALPDTQLNVLMLCPPTDQGLASETLQALDSLDVEVSLECIAETSVEAIEAQVAARKEHYHVLHVDGVAVGLDHGPGGSSFAERIGQAASEAGIPVVLLVGTDPADSHTAASNLLKSGVPEVAVLPVPLRGAGRKLFADAFYGGIASGQGAALAVARARDALMQHPHRPSAAGPLVSWDWMVPVAYRSARCEAIALKPQDAEPVIPGMLPATPEPPPRQLPRGGPYV